MISVIKKMSVTNKNDDKFKCECGSVIKNTQSNIRQHKKTLLHKNHENKERGRRRSRNRVFSECV
jgi:hypothetical protein